MDTIASIIVGLALGLSLHDFLKNLIILMKHDKK